VIPGDSAPGRARCSTQVLGREDPPVCIAKKMTVPGAMVDIFFGSRLQPRRIAPPGRNNAIEKLTFFKMPAIRLITSSLSHSLVINEAQSVFIRDSLETVPDNVVVFPEPPTLLNGPLQCRWFNTAARSRQFKEENPCHQLVRRLPV